MGQKSNIFVRKFPTFLEEYLNLGHCIARGSLIRTNLNQRSTYLESSVVVAASVQPSVGRRTKYVPIAMRVNHWIIISNGIMFSVRPSIASSKVLTNQTHRELSPAIIIRLRSQWNSMNFFSTFGPHTSLEQSVAKPNLPPELSSFALWGSWNFIRKLTKNLQQVNYICDKHICKIM